MKKKNETNGNRGEAKQEGGEAVRFGNEVKWRKGKKR